MMRMVWLFAGFWMSLAFAAEAGVGPGPTPGLSQTNGVVFKDGRPYRGVGANYFDLFLRRLHEPTNSTSLEGLRQLGGAGIPFVRFAVAYDNADWSLYLDRREACFQQFDAVVRAAEEAHVGLIPSFFWSFQSFPDLVHEPRDQWGNPNRGCFRGPV